jgi:hypothetical protein
VRFRRSLFPFRVFLPAVFSGGILR